MRSVNSLEDARVVIQQLQDRLDKLESHSINFHGRRITNASASKDDNDYVIRKEIKDIVAELIKTTVTIAEADTDGIIEYA